MMSLFPAHYLSISHDDAIKKYIDLLPTHATGPFAKTLKRGGSLSPISTSKPFVSSY